MQFKPEVIAEGVAPEIWYALGVADQVHRTYWNRQMVVCSMRDGQHMAKSLHAQGRAVDIRTHDLSATDAGDFCHFLQLALAKQGFDVVHEAKPEHIHIEYDPKPGRGFQKPARMAADTPNVYEAGEIQHG